MGKFRLTRYRKKNRQKKIKRRVSCFLIAVSKSSFLLLYLMKTFLISEADTVTLQMASQWNCHAGTHGCGGKCSKSKKSDTHLMFWYRFQPGSPLMWCWHCTTKRRDTEVAGKYGFGRRSVSPPAQVKHEEKRQMRSNYLIGKNMPAWFIVVMLLSWSKYLLLSRGRKGRMEKSTIWVFKILRCPLHCTKCLRFHRGFQ